MNQEFLTVCNIFDLCPQKAQEKINSMTDSDVKRVYNVLINNTKQLNEKNKQIQDLTNKLNLKKEDENETVDKR